MTHRRSATHAAGALLPLIMFACSGQTDVQIAAPSSGGSSGSGGTAGSTGGSGASGGGGSGGATTSPSSGGSGGSSAGASGSGAAGSGPAGGAGVSSGAGGSSGAGTGGSGGTAGSGVGGSAGSGNDGSVAGSAEAGPGSPPGFFVDGFLQSGAWMSYVFTYTDTLGSTISPTCTASGCTPTWGAQPCAKGSVAQDAMSASYVGLAFHTNAPKSGGKGSWAVTGNGLLVNISNPPAIARISLQEPSPKGNDQRYCAPVPAGGSGVIPWTDFKTWCWGDPMHPSVALKAGTKIEEVAVLVPGTATAATPFDFCLANILPQ